MSKLSQSDIQAIKKALSTTFATKNDLSAMEKRLNAKFATKDDLKEFATKDDLKEFATKDDLKEFATKDDLIEFKDIILSEIKNLRDDVAIVTGYRDMIEDHDQRIEKLENTLGIPQPQ